MKKKLKILILTILMLLPLNVGAASIIGTFISPIKEQEVGNYFEVPIKVDFSGLGNTSSDGNGIFMVALVLKFDDTVLQITDVSANGYVSAVYYDEMLRNYTILSITEETGANKCVDNFLVCQDYEANVKFFVKNTNQKIVDIELLLAIADTIKIDPTLESYTEDNLEEVIYSNQMTRKVEIKESNNPIIEEPKKDIVIENSKPKINESSLEKAKDKVTVSTNINGNKSSNANLISMTIDNYEIDFSKDNLNYSITVEDDIKSLNIKVAPEDEKATYEIIGNDNLKDEVKINVKAEDETEKTYTIQIKHKEKEVTTSPENSKQNKKLENIKLILIGIAGLISIIVVIALLISHHNSKKIDNALDKM